MGKCAPTNTPPTLPELSFYRRNVKRCVLCGCVSALSILLYIAIADTGTYIQGYKRLGSSEDVYRFSTDHQISCADSLIQGITLKGEGFGTDLIDASGCKLPNSTQEMGWRCVQPGFHIVFMGDSRVRQLYCYFRGMWSLTAKTCYKFQNDEISRLSVAHPITVEFRWMPRISSKVTVDMKRWLSLPPDERPHVIIAGTGVWRMRESNATVEGEESYRGNLSDLVPYITELRKHSHVIWIPQDPVSECFFEETRKMLSNRLVDRYNVIARDVLAREKIPIWWSSFLTARHFRSFSRDCVHMYPIVDQYKCQILVNWFCANHRNTSDHKECCET